MLRSRSPPRSVRVFRVDSSDSYILAGHRDEINSVEFMQRDGQTLVLTASHDGTARVWELGAQPEAEDVVGQHTHGDAVELSAQAGTTTVTAAATWPEVFAWSVDGDCQRRIALRDTAAATKVDAGVTLTAGGIALSADGTILAAARSDGTLVVVHGMDTKTPKVTAYPLTGVAFVSFVQLDGLRVMCSLATTVAMVDPSNGTPIRKVPVSGGRITALATLPDSPIVAAANDSKIVTIDMSNGKVLATLDREAAGASFCAFALVARGKTPWLLSYEDGTQSVLLREAVPAGNEELAVDGQGVTAAACSADGTLLALGTEKGGLVVWNLDARVERSTLSTAHGNQIDVVRWSANGEWLVTGSQDGAVKCWQGGSRLVGGHQFGSPVSTLEIMTNVQALCVGLRTGEVGILRMDAAPKVDMDTIWGSAAAYDGGAGKAKTGRKATRPPDRLRQQTVQAASGSAAAAARVAAEQQQKKKRAADAAAAEAQNGASRSGAAESGSGGEGGKKGGGGCCVVM